MVANLLGDDIILSQITSEARKDNYAIQLTKNDFKEKGLNLISYIRPNRLFTAEKSIIAYRVGFIMKEKIKEVEKALIRIFQS